MTEKLVFTLPVDRRPATEMCYGHIGHDVKPICRVKTSGEVYIFDGAELQDVMLVLAAPPFGQTFEQLRGVSYAPSEADPTRD